MILNWRRGFLRIWLALTVIWVALVIVFFWSDLFPSKLFTFYYISSKDSLSQSVYDLKSYEIELINRNEKLQVQFPTFEIVFPQFKLNDRKVIELGGQRAKDAKAESVFVEWEKLTKEDMRGLLERGQQMRRDIRIEAATEAAEFAIIPPVCAFILGYLIGWILRGFRRTDTKT